MMQKIFRCALAFAFVLGAVTSAAAGEVKVTLNQGLVTILATDAPISQILSEWARVGQTKFVNAEKMMSVVSLQLVDMPERKALDIILRSASGYMAAERSAPLAGASVFDRIMILPYSRPPATAPLPASASMPQPFGPRPQPFQPQPQPQPDDEPVAPPTGQQNQPGQMTSPMPGMLPSPGNPQNPNQPQQQTLPRPGFLPAPPGPQQPVPFGTPPGAPTKPPGGGGGSGGGQVE